MTQILQTPAADLSPDQLHILASLVASRPVTHGGITAQLIAPDLPTSQTGNKPKNQTRNETEEKGENDAIDEDVKLRLTVGSKWIPPMYDEDGFLSDKLNPYDRRLIITPNPAAPATISDGVNLLDLVQSNGFPARIEEGNDGKDGTRSLIVPRRDTCSPAGKDFLTSTSGSVWDLIRTPVTGANRLGATFYLRNAVIDDVEAFEAAEDCEVHFDLVLVPDATN